MDSLFLELFRKLSVNWKLALWASGVSSAEQESASVALFILFFPSQIVIQSIYSLLIKETLRSMSPICALTVAH